MAWLSGLNIGNEIIIPFCKVIYISWLSNKIHTTIGQ
jgi:hypothetical protein